MLDGHLDNLRLLDAAPALPEVAGGDQAAKVGQTVVHPVPPPLLDYSVRQRVLGAKILRQFLIHSLMPLPLSGLLSNR